MSARITDIHANCPRNVHKRNNVWGGYCGTDGRHIGEITQQQDASAILPIFRPPEAEIAGDDLAAVVDPHRLGVRVSGAIASARPLRNESNSSARRTQSLRKWQSCVPGLR